MAKYDGIVTVIVATTYNIRLECEAEDEREAAGTLGWTAMGLAPSQIVELAGKPEGTNEGSEVTVETVWGVDTMPTSIEDY